jgi:hypothetical protein
VLLQIAHLLDERRDRRVRKRVLQLGDEEARLVRSSGQAEQRESEEEERHEGEESEVGDHRGEVRPAVGEELLHEATLSLAHVAAVWATRRPTDTSC